jgi:Domain of unknown function (DUF4386)
MSFAVTGRIAPVTLARITGGLYVLYMVVSVLADALGHIGLGDAQQMYSSITTQPGSFRLGLAFAFVSAFLFLVVAWGLYVLLQTVNRDLALLFLLLNAVGVAIQCASLLQLISAIQAPEVAATALLAANVYRGGFAAAQLFFGTWLFPLGYLVLKSKFLPRLLGILLILDGFAEMIWFFQALLLPAYPAIKVPGTVVSLLAEVGLALWLLIRGVKDPIAAPEFPLASRDARADTAASV